MDFLSQLLPILIYFLLIIVIIVGIVLGIKLIITIDKILTVVDNVNDKIEKVSPLFNTVGMISNKFSDIVGVVVSGVEKLISKVFIRNKRDKEMEAEENE